MPRYSNWTTVITGDPEYRRKHRSEDATYRWLRENAADLPDGTLIEVQVTEGSGTRVYTFEQLIVHGGKLEDR